MEKLPPQRSEASQRILQRPSTPWLGLEEIKALLFTVAFEALTRGRITDVYLAGIVADQPGPMQTAWVQAIA